MWQLTEIWHAFQSSPTPKGGRYAGDAHVAAFLNAFQSSPTPKGGRYRPSICGTRSCPGVSILAHPERWALHLRVAAPHVAADVSILAHPERWALRVQHAVHALKGFLFQSSPTPKGGRYIVRLALLQRNPMFQSSPTPKGGRYHRRPVAPITCSRVSILAHPERWALPSPCSLMKHVARVSILAHPERWALPVDLTLPDTRHEVSILAHPERWALRQYRRWYTKQATYVSILAHPERWALPGGSC